MEIMFIQFVLNLSKYERLKYFINYLYLCPESAIGICNYTHYLTRGNYYCYLAHSTCATLFATLIIVAILKVSHSVNKYLTYKTNFYFLLPLIGFVEAVLAFSSPIKFLGKSDKFICLCVFSRIELDTFDYKPKKIE